MKLQILILSFILLAGCADTSNVPPAKEAQPGMNTHPIKFAYNEQTHLISIMGSESGLTWNQITVKFNPQSDLSCVQDTPTEGAIKAGTVIHITAKDNVECYFNVHFQDPDLGDTDLGTFNIDFHDVKQVPQSHSESQTVNEKPTQTGGPP